MGLTQLCKSLESACPLEAEPEVTWGWGGQGEWVPSEVGAKGFGEFRQAAPSFPAGRLKCHQRALAFSGAEMIKGGGGPAAANRNLKISTPAQV